MHSSSKPQQDTFFFDNHLRSIWVTPHIGFAVSLVNRCATTPKGGRFAALPTCSASTSHFGADAPYCGGCLYWLGTVPNSSYSLAGDPTPLWVASFQGAACVGVYPLAGCTTNGTPVEQTSLPAQEIMI